MDLEALAWQIFLLTGPAENILSVTHCMTRLRLVLQHKDAAMITSLGKLPGVLGVHDAGEELQVILGPGRVDKVTSAYEALAAKKSSAPAASPEQSGNHIEAERSMPASQTPVIGDGKALHEKIRARNATPIKLLFKRIASIFIPLIPAFIACGLISGLLNVAGKTDPALTQTSLYQLLAIAGNTVFWGMNLFVGYNAAKEFGGTPIIGGILGALISIRHWLPSSWAAKPGAGRGGVIAVLLVAALQAVLEKCLRRIIPDMFSLFLTPLFTFLLAGTAAICILQPLGG